MERSSPNTHKVFAHLVAERAPLYRAVMGAFVEAKARFSLHMRPKDLLLALGRKELQALPTEELLESALSQLCEWGNLEAHPDTADVATVEDFYRRRFLYQLTPMGEACERALELFQRTLEQPGELQTVALADIRVMLGELLLLVRAEELDGGKVHRSLRELSSRFDELTRRAQVFIGGLQRTVDLQGIDLEAFLAYKETLIDYLERFVSELVLATSDIAALLVDLEAEGPERLLRAAAERELRDAVEPTEKEREAAFASWLGRWRGLTSWFVGGDGVSQAEVLRARARAAIPALLGAAESIHDQRQTKSDRTTDLRTLARWFAEADSDRDAHRLWRVAFGLGSCRHLRVDAATLASYDQRPVASTTSWLEAPPLLLPVRLRKIGRYARRGRAAKVIDRSREKAVLAALVEAEAAQILAARERLARGGERMRLSEVGELDTQAFGLFLDLLGEALARRPAGGGPVRASSSDGALSIVLVPLEENARAMISTPLGLFSGRDHWITISEVGVETSAMPRTVEEMTV